MDLIAAIDLLGGRAVRLRQGDYERPIADADPAELAARWSAAGAPWLHVVDLEGARSGEPRQTDVLAAVVRAAVAAAPDVRVEAGGGLRSEAAVAATLDAGAQVAVLGTAAVERAGFLEACARRWPGRIAAALDLREGRLSVDGWLRETGERGPSPVEVARRLVGAGAAAIVVTDVRRDGAMAGPNLELLAAFRRAVPDARLVASGGVRSIGDLAALRDAGMDAAIVGLALLTGDVSIEAATVALKAVAA
jgi:phosphoribosylformimino-5-aminoimidazole carboxamide ribotide isomerase